MEYEDHLRNTLEKDSESYSLHTFEALLGRSMENLEQELHNLGPDFNPKASFLKKRGKKLKDVEIKKDLKCLFWYKCQFDTRGNYMTSVHFYYYYVRIASSKRLLQILLVLQSVFLSFMNNN